MRKPRRQYPFYDITYALFEFHRSVGHRKIPSSPPHNVMRHACTTHSHECLHNDKFCYRVSIHIGGINNRYMMLDRERPSPLLDRCANHAQDLNGGQLREMSCVEWFAVRSAGNDC